MGLFIKYCEVCGKKIEKGQDVARLGKPFDSDEHAEQYTKMMEAKRQTSQEQSDDCDPVVVAARACLRSPR